MAKAEVVIRELLGDLFNYVLQEQNEFDSGRAVPDTALLFEDQGHDAGGEEGGGCRPRRCRRMRVATQRGWREGGD